MKQLLQLVAVVVIGVIVILNWMAVATVGCLVALLRYLRKPQPTRRRVVTGRIAR